MNPIGPVSPPQRAIVPIASSSSGGGTSNSRDQSPLRPPNPQIRLDHKNGVCHVEFSDQQGRIIAETEFKLSFLA
jgi:hypothetical protein